MLYVRKQGEKSHGNPVEGCMDADRMDRVFVFVDDEIGLGNTRRKVMQGSGFASQTWIQLLSGFKGPDYAPRICESNPGWLAHY